MKAQLARIQRPTQPTHGAHGPSPMGHGTWALLVAAGLLASGCGQGGSDLRVAETPKQAATQLDSAFSAAKPEFQGAARAASEALRNGDYPAAVDSLQALKASESVTPEQGMAVHSSLVVLEGGLISAMESGDAKAKQAYQRLKALKAK